MRFPRQFSPLCCRCCNGWMRSSGSRHPCCSRNAMQLCIRSAAATRNGNSIQPFGERPMISTPPVVIAWFGLALCSSTFTVAGCPFCAAPGPQPLFWVRVHPAAFSVARYGSAQALRGNNDARLSSSSSSMSPSPPSITAAHRRVARREMPLLVIIDIF